MSSSAKGITVFALVVALAGAAWGGETIHVNNASTGIEDGATPASAYRTLAAAVKDARFANNGKGGCVIVVAQGSGPYPGNIRLKKDCSGAKGSPNKIVAKKGERPVFDAKGGKHLVECDASYIVFEGLDLMNCGRSGVNISGSCERVALLGCVSHDNKVDGITCRAKNVTIKNCVVYENARYGAYVRWCKGEAVFESNTFYHNGTGRKPGQRYEIAISRAAIKKLSAKNNIFIGEGKGAALVGSQQTEGEWVADYNAHNERCGLGAPKPSAPIGPWSKHDLGAKEKAAFDPKFVAPEKGDFHLKPDSPCLKAGEGGKNMGAY